jgi:hypothetical protein
MTDDASPTDDQPLDQNDQLLEPLVEQILSDVLEEWIDHGQQHGRKNIVLQTPDGEPFVVVKGRSIEEYGGILLNFFPRDAVRRIILECELFLQDIEEQFSGGIDFTWGEAGREATLYSLARFASASLLAGLPSRIHEAIKDQYKESMHLAVTRYYGDFYKQLGIKADARPVTKERSRRAAARERERFAALTTKLPNVKAAAGRGRPEEITKRSLLDAITARRERGEPVVAKGLANDLNKDASTVRKAAKRHEIELEAEE